MLLFNEEEDYSLFLDRFISFTHQLFEVWAYALLRNHVHLIIKTTSAKDLCDNNAINRNIQTQSMQRLIEKDYDEDYFDAVVERQVNSLMVSYVNTINNRLNKTGGFFQKPFRRVIIENDAHLELAIIYVHANAQKHGLIDDFKRFPYQSYHEILINQSNYVKTDEVTDFFGSTQQFILRHHQQVAWYYSNDWPSSKIEV
ncbi:MAG: hypothetical protein JST86_07615 [Bacteroidetes bacterium]|nr:hypothetical protein [Bacteroidota bacterium]